MAVDSLRVIVLESERVKYLPLKVTVKSSVHKGDVEGSPKRDEVDFPS